MKKLLRFISTALCALSLSSAFALDYGFLIDNDTTFKTNSAKNMYLLQKDSASAWIKVPFGQNPNNYFAGEGIYKFEYNADSKQFKHFLDINLLKFVITKQFDNGSLQADLGRFFVVDASGLVFTQNCDGAFVKYSNSIADLSVYAGYTGLLNGNTVMMINSPSFIGNDPQKLYDISDRNAVAMITGSFPALFADQTLTVQALGSFRTDAITYNRIYATVGLAGPVTESFYYNVIGTVSFVSFNGNAMTVSPLIKADLIYYLPSASVGASVVYAGNDFTGLTSQQALDSNSEPEYKDLLKAGLFATVKPLENLLFKVSADVAFDGSKNMELKGIQYKLAADYQIVSDVMVGASWSQYIDVNKSDADAMAVSVKAKIAF